MTTTETTETATTAETATGEIAADETVTADTVTTETAAAAAAPAAGGSRPHRGRLLAIVLAALVLVSAVAVGVLGWRAFSDARAQGERDAALAAAKADTTQVLSYDSRTLDADLANSRKVISGSFAAKFEELANSVIVPAVRQQSLSTKATVVRAAVIDAQPNQVSALLFVNQTTTMGDQPAPRNATNQVKVTMTWADGKWLISDMQPL